MGMKEIFMPSTPSGHPHFEITLLIHGMATGTGVARLRERAYLRLWEQYGYGYRRRTGVQWIAALYEAILL